MQTQIIPINTATENKPIRIFRKVLLLPLALLFIIVSLITKLQLETSNNSSISLPINLFLQTQFL